MMRRRGFTLMEVFLVIALLAILTSMAVPVFSGALARRELIESAEQLRSMCYMASAEAKKRGRRIELRFTDPPLVPLIEGSAAARGVEARIETDPLKAPGQFEPLDVDWAQWSAAGRYVQVVGVQMSDPLPVGSEADSMGGEEGERLKSILLSPAGRSLVGDVTITLRNAELRGYNVLLRGATGLATIEPALSLEELEQEIKE